MATKNTSRENADAAASKPAFKRGPSVRRTAMAGAADASIGSAKARHHTNFAAKMLTELRYSTLASSHPEAASSNFKAAVNRNSSERSEKRSRKKNKRKC